MKLINCPDEAGRHLLDYQLKTFLAGGITDCPNWQQLVIEELSDQKRLLVMNPRRADFDTSDPKQEKFQIDWEYRHIKYATVMFFWFPMNTLCPITLLELGKCMGWHRNMVVGCHPLYKRRTDVIEQLSLECPGVEVRSSLQDVVDDLKRFIQLPLYTQA